MPLRPYQPPEGYRPALDGIRAIAVSSVVAYHLEFSWLPGGFLGVDIFFVLSGYLITGLLVAEHTASGRISLSQFWTRRARRLFPALVLMLAVVALGVRMLRPVTEWSAKLSDLLWTLFYGANWHQIIMSQDYFARFGSASPLRHMWSIAIEEQFYLVWPVIAAVMLLPRARRLFLPVIVAAMLASAAAMAGLFNPANPTRAYVGTDARAHALLAGAALAVVMHFHGARAAAARVPARWIAGPCAIGVGLALIALSDASPLYYKGGSLVVVVAAAVVILNVETDPLGLIARALRWRPLVWVGQISYGLYLWHWPAILFTPTLLVRLFGGTGLAIVEHRASLAILIVAETLSCAVVSYYLVERPIRHGARAKVVAPPNVALASLSAACAVFLAVNLLLEVPDRLMKQVRSVIPRCDNGLFCRGNDGGPGRPVMALLGDSVAKSLVPAFAQLARQHAWTFVSGAYNRCSVLQHWVAVENWSPCYQQVPTVRKAVLSERPDLIVVSDNWLAVASFDDAGHKLEQDSPAHVADIERRMNALIEELTSTGAMVVLMRLVGVAPPLECEEPAVAALPHCRALNTGFDRYNAMFDRIAARYPGRVRTIDLGDVLCPDKACRPKHDGIILRYDTLHFSEQGARWIAPHLKRKFAEARIPLDL